MFAAGCLFLDLGLGHAVPAPDHNYRYETLNNDGVYVTRNEQVPEALYFEGPVGRFRLGFEHHKTGIAVEFEHISHIDAEEDNGFDAFWISRAWRF
jgi:hypothetical protein